MKETNQNIALIGGGPAALFMLKHLAERKIPVENVLIFEKKDRLGVGMPYGRYGAEAEHVANVSANELPPMEVDFAQYSEKYDFSEYADFFHGGELNAYKVIPRRLLGDFLEYSFKKYIEKAAAAGIHVTVKLESEVLDVKNNPVRESYDILTAEEKFTVGRVVLCTGHFWPKKEEGRQPGWFDSPYPPAKIQLKANFPVAVKGASLTAVDAIKTLARANGSFHPTEDGALEYTLDENSPNFRIDVFSLRGFLPALRFHTADDAYSPEWTMTLDEIYEYKNTHGGFVGLDYVFDRNFKKPLKRTDPDFYAQVKDLSLEAFTEKMLEIREELDNFRLLAAEYREAEKSIHRYQSIAWKEALSAFSYAVNYPAKHFSAEDMLRLKKTLMPLISVIIASLPQSSYHELMALHRTGCLEACAVGPDSRVIPDEEEGCRYIFTDEDGKERNEHYRIYVDATGQKPMLFNDLPFPSLKESVTPGFLYFRETPSAEEMENNREIGQDSSGKYFLKVPGLAINDHFQALDSYGVANQGLYIMAVPLIGGLNPDYSGLDFCDTAAARIAEKMAEIPLA